MTPDDQAQWPIERLASLLLQRVREDASLALRSAANDDGTAFFDALESEIAGLPVRQAAAGVPDVPLELPGAASPGDLEALVAMALESAQDAAGMAHAASQENRRARHYMLATLAVGVAGVAIAAAGPVGAWLHPATDPRVAQIAVQMQAIDTLQRQISQQLAALQTHPPPHPTTIAAPQTVPAAAALPPLPTIHVRVLPAVPARPALQPASAEQPFGGVGTTYATQAATNQPAPPPPAAPAPAREIAHRPAEDAQYRPVVLPWPAVYVIGTVQRDMRALFR